MTAPADNTIAAEPPITRAEIGPMLDWPVAAHQSRDLRRVHVYRAALHVVLDAMGPTYRARDASRQELRDLGFEVGP